MKPGELPIGLKKCDDENASTWTYTHKSSQFGIQTIQIPLASSLNSPDQIIEI
jgi:hypothetical protein